MMTYREVLQKAEETLQSSGVENARYDSRELLFSVSGLSMTDYLLRQSDPMPEAQRERYEKQVEKRARRIPLQHLTGRQEFMGLTFAVSGDVLIPRQDTELLAEEALRQLDDLRMDRKAAFRGTANEPEQTAQPEQTVQPGQMAEPGQTAEPEQTAESGSAADAGAGSLIRVLDLCTGSGCLAVVLAHERPWISVTAADLSEEALVVARENARRNETGVSFVQGDLFEPLDGMRFDMIVSNPPYIRSAEIDSLMPEVREHEPRMALDGAEDGLHFYRRIVRESRHYLEPGGRLLFEIGCDQGQAVSSLLNAAGFDGIRVLKDYAGLERVVTGRLVHRRLSNWLNPKNGFSDARRRKKP